MGLALERLSSCHARDLMNHLLAVPEVLSTILARCQVVPSLADRFAECRDFLYLGRGIHFPVALEGALKLSGRCRRWRRRRRR